MTPPMTISPKASVSTKARLGKDVKIGDFCIVGPRVTLGDGVKLHPHAMVVGHTAIAAGCEIFPFASIGNEPQDLKYKGEDSEVIIGKNNKIREYVSIHPGTAHHRLKTVVGDNCLIMAGTHIAHDCLLGDNVILVNNTLLAGHVEIGDYAILGGDVAARQYVRIGKHAMIDGRVSLTKDVIPYSRISGRAVAGLNGVNVVGLKRHGFTREVIHSLSECYKVLFNKELIMEERLESVRAEFNGITEIEEVVQFIESSQRAIGICGPEGDGK